jgi:hypothetical protein
MPLLRTPPSYQEDELTVSPIPVGGKYSIQLTNGESSLIVSSAHIDDIASVFRSVSIANREPDPNRKKPGKKAKSGEPAKDGVEPSSIPESSTESEGSADTGSTADQETEGKQAAKGKKAPGLA